jgi:hypothetical protein
MRGIRHEADAVRLDRLEGKKMAIKIKNTNMNNIQDVVLEKILYIAENRLLMKKSPFFYEQIRLELGGKDD